MKKLRSWLIRLGRLFHKSRQEFELAEELQYHLAMHIEDNICSGMNPDEARRNACLKLGGMDQTSENCRDALGFRWIEDLVRDACYGFRGLLRSPGFTSSAAIILALGIGANTAIFSFIDTAIFRPLPVFEPDRLMTSTVAWSLTDCEDVRQDDRIFSGLASFVQIPMEVRDSNYSSLSGRSVSANFFQVLGLKMAAGRDFSPGEDVFSSFDPVAVISHGYWQRTFQGDPAVVGKTIELNKEPVTIVGVAPENFQGLLTPQDVWVPIPMFFEIMHIPLDQLQVNENQIRSPDSRDLRAMGVIGRLKKGVSRQQAIARMQVLADSLHKAYPETNSEWQPDLVSADRARDPGKSRFSFVILASVGICILLITCTNIANLLLARGAVRRQEIAVRSALGASRLRVIRQLIVENSVLSIASVLVSFAFCGFMLKLLLLLQGTLGMPLILEPSVDKRMLSFAVCIGIFTTILFGMAPALVASRININRFARQQESFGLDRIRLKWHRTLVTTQIALSVILLIAAGLFARTILHFKISDLGYDRESLILTSDFLSLGRSPGVEFYAQSLERIREIPGIRSSAWAMHAPLEAAWYLPDQIRRNPTESSDDNWLDIYSNTVSPGYFRTVGIPILRGRNFADRDNENAPRVLIVNETLAQRYWPEESALGKYIQIRDRHAGEAEIPGPLYEVVGVVKDVKYHALNEISVPFIYYSYGQKQPSFNMQLHISAMVDPRWLIGSVRKACESVNPNVGIANPRLMSEQLDKYLNQERLAAFILGVFGPFSLILAAVGLYGIVSYSVAQRLPEFAMRVALGAQRTDITKMVAIDGMISAFAGLGIGIPVSITLSRVIADRMHGGISSLDPVTYILVSTLCIAIAFAAAILPARKAHLYPFSLLRN